MDARRFGRALGVGTRALAEAIDAAASPSPTSAARALGQNQRAAQVGSGAARGAVEARTKVAAVQRGGRGFVRAVWSPAARAGGVLWFEITGVFFGLFALAAAAEVWKRRLDLIARGAGQQKALFAVAMLLAFGWFTLSSFRKARRRAHRP